MATQPPSRRHRRLLFALLSVLLPMAAMAGVSVEGLDKAQTDNVLAWLSIADLPQDASAQVASRRHRRAREEIRIALQALGHYQPRIETRLEISDAGAWQAIYRVEAGPLVRYREIQLEYQGPGAESLRAQVPPPAWQGQPLDHSEYARYKDELLNTALAAGYLEASITVSRLRVDVEANRVDLQIQIATGPLYLFGRIDINQDILDPDFLGRYVQIRSGDAFSSERLLALQLRLTDLDYFRNIELDTEELVDPPRVDVNIDTEPKPPQRYQAGLGYGTDTGARFTLNSEFRRINRHGHRLQSKLRIAEIQQRISAQYLIPTGDTIGEHWSLQSQYEQQRFADSESEDLRVGLARTLIDGPRLWQYFLTYQLEDFRVGVARDQTELLLPGVSLTLRQADDSLNPRRGYRLSGEVKAAHDDFVSSDSFVQTLAQARWITPLGARGRLLLRGQLGYSFVGQIADLPLSQRFFTGGDQSVRGYAYQSLGPRDGNGDVVGGNYLSVASIEIDHLLWRNYGLAVFYDYGGASDRPLGDQVVGTGLGFRWRTGIGMLRADLAWPLDRDNKTPRIHIGIGAEL